MIRESSIDFPEIWKPVIVAGKRHVWYSVSNHGKVASHLRPNFGFTEYDPSYKFIMKSTSSSQRDHHLYVKLIFPTNFFENTLLHGHEYQKSGNRIRRKFYVHKLVLETFRPIDKFPPDSLKLCWKKIPPAAKKWIKQTVYINHIDHDPTNNTLNNLEYVTPQENTRKAVKHYGGNLNKKSNFIGEIPEQVHDLNWAFA